MDIKELLKTLNDWLLQIAKSLHDGDTDQAVDLLTKHAEDLKALIEKTEDDPAPEPTPTDPKENESDDVPPADDPQEEPEKKPVEKKVTIELTKTQAEWLEKFVEMYISAWDIADFVEQFDEIKERLSKIEKTSQQLPEPQNIKKSTLDGILKVQ